MHKLNKWYEYLLVNMHFLLAGVDNSLYSHESPHLSPTLQAEVVVGFKDI